MARTVQPRDEEVLLECSILSDSELLDLEAFLTRQPEVQKVRRRTRTRGELHGGPPSTFSIPHIDLVIHLGKEVLDLAQKATDTYVTVKVAEWLKARIARKEKEEEQADNDRHFTTILGPDGRTMKLVRRKRS